MPLIKSPELLASERASREQSAIELIAQGLIGVPLSARQQKAYDDAVLYAAQIEEEERQHYEQLPTQIAAENERVMSDLNAGRLYLANEHSGGAAPTIHFASCFSIRHQVDRDVAHELENLHDEGLEGSWHAGSSVGPVSKWPNLMTLREVEDLPAYRACRSCNPDTTERQKTATPKMKPSRLSSITVDRIGRRYETTSGEYLGVLESYTVGENLIELNCSDRNYQGSRDSLVVLLPK